jgi:hypothetical protein
MSQDEENINRFKVTEVRNFQGLQGSSEMNIPMCKFFLKGLCTHGSKCKFSHNIRNIMTNSEVLTPKQMVINEIEEALIQGKLDTIFKKMLSNEDDYNKYYFEIHMKFRGIAIMNLKGESIVKSIIDRISLRNVMINGTVLKYGYMPFLLHFIMNGFSWNTFQGARNDSEYNKVTECFDNIVEQLQKVKVKDHQIPKYTIQEYEEIVISSCEFVDPETYDNAIHVASHYLCDQIVQHIKDVFKSNARSKLAKMIGDEEVSKKRLSMGESEFGKLLNTNFNTILNETNKEDKKAYDIFIERKENKSEAIEKYNTKHEKAIKRARGNQANIDEADERLAYNLKQLDRKIDIFYTSIFCTQNLKLVFTQSVVDYNAKFHTFLPRLHGLKNKWGTRIDIIELECILNLVNINLKDKKDEYMKLIIDTISIDIMNPLDVIKCFKNVKNSDYLWYAVLNSITKDKPETFSVDLLNMFFKEQHGGLRESYIGQYLEKLYDIGKSLSSEQREIYIETIMKTVINKDVKSMINL